MASPLTHIYIAQKFLDNHPGRWDEELFIVGTSFPDIRQLGTLGRDQTHHDVNDPSIILAEQGSFKAGVLMHSYVDIAGQELRRQFIIEGMDTQSDMVAQTAYKIAEDQVVHTTFDVNWQYYLPYFKEVKPAEISFGSPADEVNRWHEIIVECLEKPTMPTAHDLVHVRWPDQSDYDRCFTLVDIVLKSPSFEEYVKNFVEVLSTD